MATMSDARPRERSACWASNLERRTVLNRGRYHFIQKCYRIDSCAEDVRDRHSLFCCSADFANCFYVFKFQYLRGTEMAGRAKKIISDCSILVAEAKRSTHTTHKLEHFCQLISLAPFRQRNALNLLYRHVNTEHAIMCAWELLVCVLNTNTRTTFHKIKTLWK